MAVTDAQIARLRRMTHERTGSGETYSDDDLAAVIELFPVPDVNGSPPTIADSPAVADTALGFTLSTTTPPTVRDNLNWIPTYDLNAAAASIWEEKAAMASADYAVTVDGQDLARDQVYTHCMRMAGHFASRSVGGTIQHGTGAKMESTA
jgi:hypothetical protein